MNAKSTCAVLATAGFSAAALLAAAAPVHAVTMIDVMALTKDNWKWAVSSTPTGTFTSQKSKIKAGTAPVTAANVDFGFQIGDDQGVYPGLLVLSLTETKVPAPPVGSGPDGSGGTYFNYSQPGLSGTFKLLWEGGNGKSNGDFNSSGSYVFNGVTLHDNDTVLTGTISDGVIIVSNDKLASGKTIADTGVLDATFSNIFSPVNMISDPATADLQLNVDPQGLWKYVTVHGVNQLGNFTDSGNGNVFAAVPEPAAWSMMIVGGAMIGGLARRRRLVAAA